MTEPSAQNTPLLAIKSISKNFPGVQALKAVSLSLFPAEVLAVIGENGAGKSTLMKILAGIEQADSGDILLRGQKRQFSSPKAALEAGVVLVHQELSLAENLDITANIFLGREIGRFGFLYQAAMERRAARLINRVGLNLSPRTLVKELSIGEKQRVEIARALGAKSRIIILDEPTSSLSTGEAEILFEVIRELKTSGVGIIYISHRLAELNRISDRVVALRDGANAGSLSKAEINHDNMIKLMIGREQRDLFPKRTHAIGNIKLSVNNLMTKSHSSPLSFELNSGEVVGIAGLVGSGRTEVLLALFGLLEQLGGSTVLDGLEVPVTSPHSAIQNGFALVPESRKESGLLIEQSVEENLVLASSERHGSPFWINRSAEHSLVHQLIEKLAIKTPHPKQIVKLLSGGNQQKIVFGKWLPANPKILLLDEPTRGVDVGARHEIYSIINSLAAQGMAVLFVSSDLEEILGFADRALVMCNGAIAGALNKNALSEDNVMTLATGGNLGGLT